MLRFLLIIFIFSPTLLFAQNKKESKFLTSDKNYYQATKLALDAGDVARAISISEEGVRSEPANMDLQNLLGKAYLQAGYLDKARTKLLFILKVQPHNWDAKRNLINVEYQAKHYSASLSHINAMLDHAPFDSEMWTKKISIYEIIGQQHEAERLANRLYAIFPNDSNAKRLNSYYSLNRAAASVKSGNLFKAKEDLLNILKADPKNYDANVQLINTSIKNGNKEEALAETDNALTLFPGNRFFITKKLGLLEELKRYNEAIEFAKSMQRKYAWATYTGYINNLKLQAARQSIQNDPYSIYQDLYEKNPGNVEAQKYLIDNSMNRGMYEDAMRYIDKALKSAPNSNELLQKKYTVAKALNKDGQAFAIAEKLFFKNRGSSEYQEQYLNLALKNAKDLVSEQQWATAEESLKKLNPYSYVQPAVKEYLWTVYSQQNKKTQAIATINELIRSYPKNENYKLSKIGYLEKTGDLEGALVAANALPRGERYKETVNTLSMPLARKMIDDEKYVDALEMLDRILLNDENNLQAYNYAMNCCNALKRYEDGIGYADVALDIFPDSKEVLMKRAGFLQSMKRNQESTKALSDLYEKYPYSDKIKNSLLEERIVAAKNYVKANEKDSALNLYKQNYSMDENDTTTMYKIVNLYLDEKNTDSAMVYLNNGLNQYPDNAQLLMKKSVAFEIEKNYDSSFYYMSKLIPQRNNSFQNYADYLFSKTLKHQGGFLYLRTTFDTIRAGNSLASFQYTRFKANNTYTYRINYAARNNGSAMQHEFDWNHKIDSTKYTEANIGVATKETFPYFKISGSIFKTLRKNYEGEVGLKYIKLKDAGFISLVGGLSKTYNEVWINARVFVLSDGKSLYNSGRLTTRLYMNERMEYLTAMVGYGTAPDDKSLDFILNKFVGIVSRYVGAGYQKEFRYRTTLGITGTWNNIRQLETSYSNQYNLFLTVLRKF